MKIAIASGKGGTGKTTVAVNLALALEDIQLLDCDVEDPDAGIFLPSQNTTIEQVEVKVPEVDKDKCDYCRECSTFCEYNALVVLPGQWLLTPQMCKDCGGCYIVCPKDALRPVSRRIGVLERTTIGENLNIVAGRLNTGEVMPVPLIRRVKEESVNEGNVILDCPPGSACAMVNAVEDSDFCLMVTEPTPFGMHDLQQAVKVVRLMDIPMGVVINRSDLGDSGVRQWCSEQAIPILLEIPYDEALAKAYARGVPAVQDDAKWKEVFQGLWQSIEKQVNSKLEVAM